jgi:hypothetical protein
MPLATAKQGRVRMWRCVELSGFAGRASSMQGSDTVLQVVLADSPLSSSMDMPDSWMKDNW